MTRTANLKKIDKNLYEEKWEEGKKPFQWLNIYENLRLELSSVKVREGYSFSYRGKGLLDEDEDKISHIRYLQAAGEIGNGLIHLINPVKGEPDTFKIVAVTIRPVSEDDWLEVVQEHHEKATGAGFLTHVAGDNLTYTDKTSPFLDLELIIPESTYNGLCSQILSNRNARSVSLELGVKVTFFRSEVDRGLEEYFHPKDFHIEHGSKNTAYINFLTIDPEPLFLEVGHKTEASEVEQTPERSTNDGGHANTIALRKLSKQASWIIWLLAFMVVLMIFNR